MIPSIHSPMSEMRRGAMALDVSSEPAPTLDIRSFRRQILRNLLVNAVRYGGPEIRLSARVEDGNVRFDVMDNGSGVDATMSEEIFAPYRRGHDRAGLPGSVGSGLSVSRRLARMMGGDVTYTVTDEWPTFTLHLPAS